MGLTAKSKKIADSEQLDRGTFNQRGVIPYVVEGEAGELAAPAEGHRYTAEDGEYLVAAGEGAVEALVAVPPDAVDRAGSVRLSQHFLKLNLNVCIQIVRIPLLHIYFFFCHARVCCIKYTTLLH